MPTARRRQRGQGFVEFAVIVPFIALLLLGAIDFGRAFNHYIRLTNAAREGARYAASNLNDEDGIRDRVREELEGTPVANIDDDNISISTPEGTDGGDPVVVYVTYDFNTLLGAIIGMNTISVRTGARMPILTN